MTYDLLFAILPSTINSSLRKSSYSEVTPASVLGKARDLQDLKTAGCWGESTMSCRTGALKEVIPCRTDIRNSKETTKFQSRQPWKSITTAHHCVILPTQHILLETSVPGFQRGCKYSQALFSSGLVSKVSHSQSLGLWSCFASHLLKLYIKKAQRGSEVWPKTWKPPP